MEEEDLIENITRETFEMIEQKVVTKFKIFVSRSLHAFETQSVNLSENVKFDSVELVSDGTRIPIINQVIQEEFDMDCRRTMNSQDCLA